MSIPVQSNTSYTLITDDLLLEIVQKIVAAFKPQKVILFGSRAYGKPAPDSDVDLLVVTNVLKTRSVFERHRAVSDIFPDRRFALDVLVRTPKELEQLGNQGPAFFKEIITRGKVLYERWGQQSAEKYLKAYLVRRELEYPRRHDLVQLRNLCADADPDFNLLADAIATLDQFGTDIRYPGVEATREDARQSFDALKQVRVFVRAKLGLA